jgi:hypothetical protein
LRSLEQFIQTVPGLDNLLNRIFFLAYYSTEIQIATIKAPIGPNNWDVETYMKKL